MSRLKWLTVPEPIGGHLHDPAGTDPGLPDVLRRLFRLQRPADVAAVVDLVIGCYEMDLAFLLVLTADLTVQRLLVGSSLRGRLRLHRQVEVSPLHLQLSKNGFWVWSASAW